MSFLQAVLTSITKRNLVLLNVFAIAKSLAIIYRLDFLPIYCKPN